ncbi:diaminopimelate epimerase [Fusarium circinatum]|uniref:Diaminopimelate epimerase n=1 Tax=Fusarium circinatum TaxID=48490 RepID=A0A8H5WYD2_FUSCI|nr:diaminopimelate epimerase [Fusarium circinatum]
MSTIKFEKMHANGDDFVIVDLRDQEIIIDSDIARRLGDRNRGIGFNQLVVLSDCEDAAAFLVFWNADGSTLNACGSATRGAAWKLMRETGSSTTALRTIRGLLQCHKVSDNFIAVSMDSPLIDWREIPTVREVDALRLPLCGDPAACNMGNPHCTFFVDDLAAVDVMARGPAIEKHPLFPEKTNVHFVQVLTPSHIRLRIWERGGGIPLGSGSCSCGAVVNGIRCGLLEDKVKVECDGGTVIVSWDGIGDVFLEGPVEFGFRGIWAGPR